MRLCLLVCLVLLGAPRASPLRQRHSRRAGERARELPGGPTAAPGGRNFAFELFRALAAAGPAQNVFLSPLSVSAALATLSLGTRAGTRAQILGALGLRLRGRPEEEEEEERELHRGFQRLLQELGRPREDLQLGLGTALFIKPGVQVRDSFLGAARALYLADAFPADFEDPDAARKQINDYVRKQTQGKIADLVQALDGSEVMVMVNYIFFKAQWESAFDPRSTRKRDFHVSADTAVRVPTMRGEAEYSYLLDRSLHCQVVGVPYRGNATALFILPGEGRMEKAEAALSQETLRKWLKKFTKRKLQLYIPKFSIEGSYQLEKVLPELGVRDIFTSRADLAGLTNHSNIRVSEMVHRAVVEVDESGTQAAAATGVLFAFRSARVGPQAMVFDRPFLVVIVGDSDSILFLGRVARP